jgi:carbamoyl-phosphate synthase large subunit
MPKRTDIKSILIIGAGPIIIGQACEFDYSGTQACKTLKAEGYRIILVNSNPATIMTDPDLADATYIEPITPEMVEKIIAKEKPDALLPTMGGQTALNCAKKLAESGVLKKYNVELIGAKLESINKAEDRQLFNEAMDRINLKVAKNAVVKSLEEARVALERTGLPAIIRPSFTLGGTGGGIAYNREEFEQIVASGLDASPVHEVLIDQSLLGWKEYEMEVVRDKADNCIIICSIENVDPMGVHTGDSITVAPALTLTDKEYQIMRDASLAVLREIGVDTGGSNVQFAINPKNGDMVVIEMNPRVSRSSALASKATGFPIAKVAAKLAVGYTLDEIQNDITKATPASFEPSIDYVVTKIPRFTFEKFPGTEPTLTTAMKSVGEVMAIGRSFPESLQKALRSMETGLTGLNDVPVSGYIAGGDIDPVLSAMSLPTPERILHIAMALRGGASIEAIHAITKFDPWFLEQMKRITDVELSISRGEWPIDDEHALFHLKQLGFSDARIAELAGVKTADISALRKKHSIHPVYKRVDTCAAEFESPTPYLYSCYEVGSKQQPANCEALPSAREKIIILGGGPNRIGQGIEFDYCCVHAAYALSGKGERVAEGEPERSERGGAVAGAGRTPSEARKYYETIMINCNPETVSTDYDTSDRLYFEPLTAEDVFEIIRKEQSNGNVKGVIVQLGGQTPLKLARALEAEFGAGIIIGTSPDSIDLAEDRERFQKLLHTLKLKQPANAICSSTAQVMEQAGKIGYPVVVRPSYVLGGRAMRVIHDAPTLESYVNEISLMFGDGPILLDSYLSDAIEVDVDALSDGSDVYVAGIMEHIEEAGIHSGDSACSLPPYSLSESIQNEIRTQTISLAKALNVVGLMNVQFAVKGGEIFILEVNPRASRTAPFVAKATGVPIAKIGARLMAGEKLSGIKYSLLGQEKTLSPDTWHLTTYKHVAVKEAVFPFARFPGVDIILGPEMKSTGEAMGLDSDFAHAFAKAQLASSNLLPTSGKVFVSVKESDKEAASHIVRELLGMGFEVVSTRGTATYMNSHGLKVETVNKVREGRPHIVDMMKDGHIALVLNTTEGAKAIADSFSIRRTALLNKISYSTTLAGSRSVVQAIKAIKSTGLDVHPLQSYFENESKKRKSA